MYSSKQHPYYPTNTLQPSKMDRLTSSFVVVDSTTDHTPPPPPVRKGVAQGVAAAKEAWKESQATATHPTTDTKRTEDPTEDPTTFLAAALGGDDRGAVWAAALVTVTGVATMADLALVDEGMAGDAAVACGIPLVPTKKIKIALSQLRASLPAPQIASTGGETKETKDAETKDDGNNIDIVRLAAEAAASMAEQQHPPAPPAPPVPLEECIAICIDRSGSMRSPIREMTAFGDNAGKTLGETSLEPLERRSRMECSVSPSPSLIVLI